MLTLEMIQDAQQALKGIARRTPLDAASKIADNLYIKAENLQLTGAGRDRAMAQLETFGLAGLARQNAKGLSGGETARLALARVLMEDHPLLILDEPTAAMDVAAALRSEEILLEYQARTRCTVVLVTHSMTQARRMAGQVLFLKDGHLAEQGETGQVLSHPRCADTRAFLDFYTL